MTILREFRIYLERSRLEYVLLFVVIFAILTYVQYTSVIGDPDGFYHTKIALFLSQGIVLHAMPWLQFTTLAASFTDHHFLYHVLLVPFVLFGKPLVGVKLATVVFSAAFFTVFYFILRRLQLAAPLTYTLLLLGTSAFLFRLSLVKANAVSLIVLLLVILALLERRALFLGICTALYVWLYGGWPVAWVVAIIFFVTDWFIGWVSLPQSSRIHPHIRRITKTRTLFFALVAGTICGIIINPYWPSNINFYWQQIWQIAILNNGSVSGVGGEWSSLSPAEFAVFFGYPLLALMPAIAMVIVDPVRASRRSWQIFLFALLCALFAVKSRRYVELAAPMLILSASSFWRDMFAHGMLHTWWRRARLLFQRGADQLTIAALALLVTCIFLPNIGFAAQIITAHNELSRGVPLMRYARAGAWLHDNTPAGSIVFHSDWDDWPMLFYFNDHNYYLVGLDPTFMYNYSPTLYKRWATLTRDGTDPDPIGFILDTLHAQYVLIGKDHDKLQKTIGENLYSRLVYEDDDVWIYRIDNGTK